MITWSPAFQPCNYSLCVPVYAVTFIAVKCCYFLLPGPGRDLSLPSTGSSLFCQQKDITMHINNVSVLTQAFSWRGPGPLCKAAQAEGCCRGEPGPGQWGRAGVQLQGGAERLGPSSDTGQFCGLAALTGGWSQGLRGAGSWLLGRAAARTAEQRLEARQQQ